MKHWLILVLMAFGTVAGMAQGASAGSDSAAMYTTKRYNEVGLNAIGILQQLPFVNGGEVAFNNVALLWRYHWPGDKGNLRVGIGGRISSTSNIINFRVGRDRLRMLDKHWHYLRGWEWFLSANGNNSGTGQVTGGYSWINGLRYDLNDRISFATEGNLTIGASSQTGAGNLSFDVRLIPLGSLYICYRLFP